MRKQLSQQKLLEILIHEIEMLRETSKNINAIAPEIEKQLTELKTARLKVDLNTNRLDELLEGHKRELKKYVVIPNWVLYLIFGVLLAAIINWFV